MLFRLLMVFVACVGINAIKTVRKITEINGHKRVAAILIGIDTLLFMLVLKDFITNELSVAIVISMAVGYSIGYLIGSLVEEKMALGKVKVTIKIPKRESKKLWRKLNENGFVFIRTQRVYSHKNKPRKIYEGVIYRKELQKLRKILRDFNIVASVHPVKMNFGKRILSSNEYLKIRKEK